MSWLLVVLSILLLWVVSLLKVFYCSHMMSKAAFSFNGSRNNDKKKNILLVVAHPDDESMFFSPTILFFISEGHNVHILCMSAGNAEGKGDLRKEELFRACAILKVPLQQIKVLDRPDLQDGFCNPWNHQLLATIIQQEIQKHNINFIITFDNYGVSGHPNHRDVHHGLCMLLRGISATNIEAWELVSTSIPRKYSGPVDIWLSNLSTSYYHKGLAYCFLNSHPRKTYLAMAEHDSQWVWFRKLFVLLSSYTYVNTLRKIN